VRLWRCEECPNFVTDELYLTLPEEAEPGPKRKPTEEPILHWLTPDERQFIQAPPKPVMEPIHFGTGTGNRYMPVHGPRTTGIGDALVNCPECAGTLEWHNGPNVWRCAQCKHQEHDQRNIERTTMAKDEDRRRLQQVEGRPPTITQTVEG
jgi:ribosomal protein L37AE/L43A